MASSAKNVEEYIKALPPDRQKAMSAVRQVILSNLPEGYAERMQGEMIGYVVPHSLYPAGYHCDPRQPLQYAALVSEKNHMALHMMAMYGDADTQNWLRGAYKASGKKLDMGKACIRFKNLDDLPLDVIGKLIARTPAQVYITRIQKFMESRSRRRSE
jgi:hypothetical protein